MSAERKPGAGFMAGSGEKPAEKRRLCPSGSSTMGLLMAAVRVLAWRSSSFGYASLCPGEAEVWAHVFMVWPGSRVFPLQHFSIFRLREASLCCAGGAGAALCRQDAASVK